MRESTAEPGNTEIWSRPLTTASGLELGELRMLFDGWYLRSTGAGHSFDVARDGTRFLMVRVGEHHGDIAELVLVQNWLQELERLLPGEGPTP